MFLLCARVVEGVQLWVDFGNEIAEVPPVDSSPHLADGQLSYEMEQPVSSPPLAADLGQHRKALRARSTAERNRAARLEKARQVQDAKIVGQRERQNETVEGDVLANVP